MIVHPLQALSVIALVLGGPISLYSRSLGIAAGGVGMAIAGALFWSFCRRGVVSSAAVALVLIMVFMVGSAAGIAIGRISPEWLALHRAQPLPSRYLAPTLAFWAVLFPVSLMSAKDGAGRLCALVATLIVLILTIGTWNWQWRLSREWASVSENNDAIASGFFLGVSDPRYMSQIVPDREIGGRMLNYMRQEKLSIFAEPRAGWIGHEVTNIVPIIDRPVCRAAIQVADPVDDDPTAFQIAGSLTGDAKLRRLDILMVDEAGTVRGLARTLPITSEHKPATEFLGYERAVPPRNLRLFVLLRGQLFACPLQW
jgi:hypothetical protein